MKPRRSEEEAMLKRMKQIASEATEKEVKDTEALVRRATGAGESAEVYILTPPVQALLFLNHNTHNRTWKLAKVREWQRRINLGSWKFNTNGAGFFITGAVADGQHRYAAHALCGSTWKVTITFGVDPDAADTMDCGDVRTGDDAADIKYSITESKPKLDIIRAAYSYYASMDKKDETFKLRSPAERAIALKENDSQLAEAIDLGKASARGVTNPQFTAKAAATQAFILLKGGLFPAEKILEHLQRFQTGVLRLGENDAEFAAAKFITDNRSKALKGKEKAEKLSALREYGIVTAAIMAAEAGTVPTAANLRAAVAKGKPLPDPRPQVEEEEPAEAAE